MTWSKATQTVVGLVVGAVAAAGLHVISTPAEADERAPQTPRLAVVMAVDLAPEAPVSLEAAPPATPVADRKAVPKHEHLGQAVAVVEARQTAPRSGPADSATPAKAPKPPKSDPPPPPEEPAPPPPDDHHHHHHHDPPPPPPG